MQSLKSGDNGNYYCRISITTTAAVTLIIIFTLSNIDHAFGLETSNQIKKYGYPLETYQVWTEDKYLLGIERIPHSKNGNGTIGKPILLVHGLYLSSAIFTINNLSLGFALSDAGFDVWLFNARAVGLSRKLSIYKKPGSTPRMNRISWNFSFHEMGVYDMATTVDFVLRKTGYRQLDALGYSLGTTIALVCLSERPEYNSKINKLLLMAPTARLKSSGPPLDMFKRFSSIIEVFLNGFNYFPYTQDPDTTYRLIRRLCENKAAFEYCELFINVAQGLVLPINNNTIVDILSEFPQPMSTKTLKHMLQILKFERFCHYDYGYSGNMLRYHTNVPPDYNLSKITASTYILYSMNDTLVTPEDTRWLISQLPNVKDVYYIDKIIWSHFSFSLSPHIKEVINSYIINILSDNKR